jgi:outer membrane usher protein
MLIGRAALLWCASFVCAANAAAEDDAPFVTQLHLLSRDTRVDTFAWRAASGIVVPRSALATLGVNITSDGARVPLSSVAGLAYAEDETQARITITCAAACFTPQVLDRVDSIATALDRSTGFYLNYDADLEWVEDRDWAAAGVAAATAFGSFGLIESSWLGESDADSARATRLETRWTYDLPAHQIRMRAGDGTQLGVGGAPVRFGGLQIGRYFALAPSMITYPMPLLQGDADANANVELYVDGALRARADVEAGPFAFDQTPLVAGGGVAQLVITDILGRQQIISRPFFISTNMLRPGLSDWSAAIGAVREDYALADAHYENRFAAARYRRGVANWLTLEAAAETSDDGGGRGEIGIAMADVAFGQINVHHADSGDGAATSVGWFRDARAWSFGVQAETRDRDFRSLGDSRDASVRRSGAVNVAVDLGEYGGAAITIAALDFDDAADAQTLSIEYTPDLMQGALSISALETRQGDERHVSVGVHLSMELQNDIAGGVGVEAGAGDALYRASLQRAAEFDRLGWRLRGSTGRIERVELAAMLRGRFGETSVQAAQVEGVAGLRLSHSGSIGAVEDVGFAGPRIEGAFALVDAGARDVAIGRDRFRIGRSDRHGHALATNLRAYDSNTLSIEADDLPLDRAPAATEIAVRPAEGAGVLVRFEQARARLTETRVRFADGSTPPRGGMLVRVRDGARFPVGTDGRVSVTGGAAGDVLQLESNSSCDVTFADTETLTLNCRGAP